MLGEVVCQVQVPFLPMDAKLALFDPILHPIKAHVHGLGALDFGSAIGKSISCGIVCGGSCRLGLFSPEFFENLAHVGGFLAIVEQGTYFCFGGCCYDIFQDSTFHIDGAIGLWKVES